MNDATTNTTPVSGLAHHREELYALDESIRRLALASGTDVSQEWVVMALVDGRQDGEVADGLPARTRRTIRGLLLLKHVVARHCAEDLGEAECRRLIAEHAERLSRRGF